MSAPTPVTVEQVIDGETWCVQLTLDVEHVIGSLAKKLRGHTHQMVLVRQLPPEHPDHIRARAELVQLLDDTLTVTLTAVQAAGVESALYYAAQEPERCEFDQRFAVAEIDGFHLCGGCAKSYDDSREASI